MRKGNLLPPIAALCLLFYAETGFCEDVIVSVGPDINWTRDAQGANDGAIGGEITFLPEALATDYYIVSAGLGMGYNHIMSSNYNDIRAFAEVSFFGILGLETGYVSHFDANNHDGGITVGAYTPILAALAWSGTEKAPGFIPFFRYNWFPANDQHNNFQLGALIKFPLIDIK